MGVETSHQRCGWHSLWPARVRFQTDISDVYAMLRAGCLAIGLEFAKPCLLRAAFPNDCGPQVVVDLLFCLCIFC